MYSDNEFTWSNQSMAYALGSWCYRNEYRLSLNCIESNCKGMINKLIDVGLREAWVALSCVESLILLTSDFMSYSTETTAYVNSICSLRMRMHWTAWSSITCPSRRCTILLRPTASTTTAVRRVRPAIPATPASASQLAWWITKMMMTWPLFTRPPTWMSSWTTAESAAGNPWDSSSRR